MNEMSREEWVANLRKLSPKSSETHLRREEERLSSRLMMSAAELHSSMAAWHGLGASETVRSLFRRLARHLDDLSDNRGGRIKKLSRWLKSFLHDRDQLPELPDDVLQRLGSAYQQTHTYLLRLNKLAEEHSGALAAYTEWNWILSQLVTSPEATQANYMLAEILRRSVELISAQQQLALAVKLHQQNIQTMASEIKQASTLAKTLSITKDAAELLGEKSEVKFLFDDANARESEL